jgi:hypothetical protein
MYREASAALSRCVRPGLAESELTDCLVSAGYRKETIRIQHPEIYANRCRDYWLPMMATCATFHGTAADGRLEHWFIEMWLDGP